MSVYTFITAAFRYADSYDQAVRTNYPLARAVEINSRITELTDAQPIADTIRDLLKQPRILFEVPVLGVNVVTVDMYSSGTPCAVLTQQRFNLQGGRLVAIVEFEVDLNQGQTVLRCWG